MFKKFSFFISFTLLFITFTIDLQCFAQAQDSTSTPKIRRKEIYDTTYIKQYRNQWCITLLGIKRDFFMDITNPAARNQVLTFSPRNQYSWGLGLDYKWFTVELSMKYPFHFSTNSQRNNLGLRIGLTRQKFWFSSFYQRYRGLNMGFSSDSMQVINRASIPSARGDIYSSSLHLSLNYGFNNKKYSQMAALWQIDRQLKSAGTLVAGISAFFYQIRADSTLVPNALNRFFSRESQVIASTTKNIGINFGYSHSFVIQKKFFIHLSLIPSVSYQHRKYDLVQSKDLIVSGLSISSEARFIAGYNSEQWYGGFNFVNYSFTENSVVTGAGAVLNYNFFRWFVGFRLKSIGKK
jgi:hypothetical protein